MARVAKKKKPVLELIKFSRARDIPFNRIHLSNDNVREVDVEAGLDELTFDIERREDLIQGINVRAVLDADGNESGDYETPAGGRRYRAISRLVEAGRFPADGLVPCIVKKANAKTSAVDDSLAENTFRLALLGSVSQLSCWVRTAVMVMGENYGAYQGRHTDVRVKRSRSEARTTLEAAATPQAF